MPAKRIGPFDEKNSTFLPKEQHLFSTAIGPLAPAT
jgi:hypothetical protein